MGLNFLVLWMFLFVLWGRVGCGEHPAILNSPTHTYRPFIIVGHYRHLSMDIMDHTLKIAVAGCESNCNGSKYKFTYEVQYNRGYMMNVKSRLLSPLNGTMHQPGYKRYMYEACKRTISKKLLGHPDRNNEILNVYLKECLPLTLSNILSVVTIGDHFNSLRATFPGIFDPEQPMDISVYSKYIRQIARALHRMNNRLYNFYQSSRSFLAGRLRAEQVASLKEADIRREVHRIYSRHSSYKQRAMKRAARNIRTALHSLRGSRCPEEQDVLLACQTSVYRSVELPLINAISSDIYGFLKPNIEHVTNIFSWLKAFGTGLARPRFST